MIYNKVIKIQAENYLEEQFLLQKFPGVIWHPPVTGEGFASFYLPVTEETNAKEALNEYKEWKEKASGTQ